MQVKTLGSVCSGIEAATVSFSPYGIKTLWVSEIAEFQSNLLAQKYPETPNLGDMTGIPNMILHEEIPSPDMICGGTPCQAFSLVGYRKGLEDERGNLTLKYIDVINANDKVRLSKGLPKTIMLWENVEGVLTDKTNAFGCFVSFLAGLDKAIDIAKWPTAGVIHGKERNVAWRVMDAKFFGIPQQRKRLYVIAGDTNFYPEDILFEEGEIRYQNEPNTKLTFKKGSHSFEVFRNYTDCLYAAYGTKWNGNAAAYNGSLFVHQDDEIRRLSPLECERLMGFPDDYTDIPKAKLTNRYQGTGNSWVVPVIKWIGSRISSEKNRNKIHVILQEPKYKELFAKKEQDVLVYLFGKDFSDGVINCSTIPCNAVYGDIRNVIEYTPNKQIVISPVGCGGILRRKRERNLKMNERLEVVLQEITDRMDPSEIEKKSRIQPRGRFSESLEK